MSPSCIPLVCVELGGGGGGGVGYHRGNGELLLSFHKEGWGKWERVLFLLLIMFSM